MSEIVKQFKYLSEKANYFLRLQDDKVFLFNQIVKVSHDDTRDEIKSYIDDEKIEKIRF